METNQEMETSQLQNYKYGNYNKLNKYWFE